MARWILVWSLVSILAPIAFAAGCGGKEEAGPSGVRYGEGGYPSYPRDAAPVDMTCEPVGSQRECVVETVTNGIKSCFRGKAVCQGEDGWSTCLDATDARAMSAALKAAPPSGAAGAAGAGATADQSEVAGAGSDG